MIVYADTMGEIVGALANAAVSLLIVTVAWFLVAPFFGIRVDGQRSRSAADLYEVVYGRMLDSIFISIVNVFKELGKRKRGRKWIKAEEREREK